MATKRKTKKPDFQYRPIRVRAVVELTLETESIEYLKIKKINEKAARKIETILLGDDLYAFDPDYTIKVFDLKVIQE